MQISAPPEFPDLKIVTPKVFGDDRGYFLETYSRKRYSDSGIVIDEVQTNRSRSVKHTLRAIHFQLTPGQPKLVTCARGEVFQVAVDLRKNSPTYKQYFSIVLDDISCKQLYIPVGFGNGFLVLSDVADYCYLVGNYYNPATEAGIAYDDPEINITWPTNQPIVSERDTSNSTLKEFDWTDCIWHTTTTLAP